MNEPCKVCGDYGTMQSDMSQAGLMRCSSCGFTSDEADMGLKVMWTLKSAMPVLRRFEQFVKPLGFHVALGGSVLYQGCSDKDLDVHIYKHAYPEGSDHPTQDFDLLRGEMRRGLLDLIKLEDASELANEGENPYEGEDGDRDVWRGVWRYRHEIPGRIETKRIDFFFMHNGKEAK